MAEDLLSNHREHFPPDRVSAFLNGEVNLSLCELAHLETCDECQQVFKVCLEATKLKNVDWKEAA